MNHIHYTDSSINEKKRKIRGTRIPVLRVKYKRTNPVTFSDYDLANVYHPHNEALVIYVSMDKYNIHKVIIDQGARTNVIFRKSLDEMKIEEGKIRASKQKLVGFNNAISLSVGIIELPIVVRGVTKVTLVATPSNNAERPTF